MIGVLIVCSNRFFAQAPLFMRMYVNLSMHRVFPISFPNSQSHSRKPMRQKDGLRFYLKQIVWMMSLLIAYMLIVRN